MGAPAQPSIPPHSDPFVAEVIAQLQQQLHRTAQLLDAASLQYDAQAKQLQSTAAALENAQLTIQLLTERLRLERTAKYSKSSEKLSDLQLDFLDLEPGVSSEEVRAESECEPISVPPAALEDKTTQKPRSQHPGRQTLHGDANITDIRLQAFAQNERGASIGKFISPSDERQSAEFVGDRRNLHHTLLLARASAKDTDLNPLPDRKDRMLRRAEGPPVDGLKHLA